MNPEAIAREYFDRMRRRASVAELFHDDAILLGLGMRVEGRDAIDAFYRAAQSDAAPTPAEPVVLLADSRHVAAEIFIGLADGSKIHAVDLFEVADGRIQTLKYFIAEDPPDE